MVRKMNLSTLPKTWILDLDGTIVKHNGYKIDGYDTLLPNVKEYFQQIPASDVVIILTARNDRYREQTIDFLRNEGIHYTNIMFNMPLGERIVINDKKPSGLRMAFSINLERNKFTMPIFNYIK